MRAIFAILAIACAISIAVNAFGQTAKPSSWEQRSAMPSSQLVWGSIAVIDNDPCCGEVDRSPLEASPDVQILETVRDQAFRMGPILWLKLEGNRSLKIIDPRYGNTNCLAVDVCRRHILAAWWPKWRYYVVDVSLYEERQAYLISEHDGRISVVFAPPILSPSGRYAVAWDASPAYGNGLQLIDMSADPPTMLDVKSMPACPGTKQQYSLRPTPVWTDDSHIKFEGKPLFDNDDPDAKQLLRIVDGKPEWEC